MAINELFYQESINLNTVINTHHIRHEISHFLI